MRFKKLYITMEYPRFIEKLYITMIDRPEHRPFLQDLENLEVIEKIHFFLKKVYYFT